MFVFFGEELDIFCGGDCCKLFDIEFLLLFCIVGLWWFLKDFMMLFVRFFMEVIWCSDVLIEYMEFCGEFFLLLRFVDVFLYFGGDLLLFIEVGLYRFFLLLFFCDLVFLYWKDMFFLFLLEMMCFGDLLIWFMLI